VRGTIQGGNNKKKISLHAGSGRIGRIKIRKIPAGVMKVTGDDQSKQKKKKEGGEGNRKGEPANQAGGGEKKTKTTRKKDIEKSSKGYSR